MKRIYQAGLVVLAIASSSAFAQSVYEPQRPESAQPQEQLRDESPRANRSGDERRRTQTAPMQYDSQNPAANSAIWGVGG